MNETETKSSKLLSIAIPCYNSSTYMDRAIRSCLIQKPGIEILIIDDGSSDSTLEKAQQYQKEYPDTIKVIHKENGGHGDAVMSGLHAASGLYFKVLDSDDWLGREALQDVMEFLETSAKDGILFDMLLSDYIYEKKDKKKKHRVDYKHVLPVRTPFTWQEIGTFFPWQNILMHSVIYRREPLLQSGLTLPKHTFYVDNIYVYHPLPYMKKLFYLDVDLYHYYIGRDDQSVNEKNMIQRIDQQLLVTRLMIQDHPLRELENRKLRRYMSEYLAVMMTISTTFLIKDGSKEALMKRDALWKYLKQEYPEQYTYINHHFLGHIMQHRSKLSRCIIKTGYNISRRLVGFN